MHPFLASAFVPCALRVAALAVLILVGAAPARAATALADQPIFASANVPGNLALLLSVEFPTAVSVAHTNRTYASATEYLGFFDPNKCYDYTAGVSDAEKFFTPSALGTAHVCSGKWSGNFLNWASMQTIDPFRWVLSGGYRVIDETTRTVVEKAWASGQGGTGNFPDSTLSSASVAGATPFSVNNADFYMRIQGLGNKMRFTVPKNSQSPEPLDGSTPVVPYNGTATGGKGVFETFMRAKVCDKTLGTAFLETNCVAYGVNYKPEGLLQKYSNKIRYSAFGYLNDDNILRDGGVLRAQQKFVGPTKPVPGSAPVTNAAREWDASTGVFKVNPDTADASSSSAIFGAINNSGVINYLNKFGQITPGGYKTYDNVSELYYAAIRYFKALSDVPEWTAVGTADAATKAKWADGFPVITSPVDPILYSCQKNFVLGIGDVNTHADKNLPGRLASQTGSEPPLPAAVLADTSVDAVDATDKVGALEGMGAIGSNATYNTPALAGLAYDSHIKDIRPDDPNKPNTTGKQTIDTYWVDVQEYQAYNDNNQFYLATKYGGFTVPAGYNVSNTTPLTQSWWHTNPDTLGSNKRPDNYFAGGRPDLVKLGLETAFAKIADSISAFTTSFSTPLPQLAGNDDASYSGTYDAKNWTGEMVASRLTFDPGATSTTVDEEWKFTNRLATQLGASNGWDLNRFVTTWNKTTKSGAAFRSSGPSQIDSGDLGELNTSYVAVDDKSDYLDYLRGDQSNEVGGTGKQVYRARVNLVGDIVGSKLTANGPPSFPFSDSTNPGYSKFKTDWKDRRTVVYFGANDGMMHAVNGAFSLTSVAVEKDARYGQEMFAYIPRALFKGPTAANTDGLASLGNPGFVHHYMVNATPTVSDVDFSRVPNSSNAKQSPAASTFDWRSVLIGGLGKGGKAYYAIDVTDPVSMAVGTVGATEAYTASKVLWEFTDTDLGFSFGESRVIKTKKYGWVVVLTSGYNNTDGKGWFFFVNPKTGALLEKVSTNTGSTSNDAGLAHAEAFAVNATDGTADAIYAGDLLGNLWRLDVTSTTGTYADAGKLVKLAELTDASGAANPQPVTTRPVIEVSTVTKKRYVMVGTGRLLDTTDIASTQGQTFYAFTDGTNAAFNITPFAPVSTPAYPIVRSQLTVNTNPLLPIVFDPAPNAGWLEELGLDRGTAATTAPVAAPAIPSTGIAYRVITDLKSASGSVTFAATLPSGSVCTPSGISDAYARDFASAQSTLGTDALRIPYVSLSNVVTDLGYVSVGGRLRLLAGTDKGVTQVIPIVKGTGTSLRRLNWRELQIVD